MSDGDLRAAVAAGVLGAEELYAQLLRSVVEVARSIFGAKGSSVFLLDEETDELVFAAVAAEEEQHLLGMRIPSSTGIAGWVLVTRQPLILDDLENDPRHARDVAARTGYVPKGLMAVPLLHEERVLGVLQVLDRRTRFTMREMDLLGLFANQAAIALDLLQRARRARAVLSNGEGIAARLAEAVEALPEERRDAGLALLASLTDVLAG